MYLLDTDTIIYTMNGHAAVQANLRIHLNDPLNICTVTLMELYYGAYKSREVTSNIAKIKTMENSLNILLVGTECVEVFGSLKASLEKTGSSVDDFDLIIASCAIANNLVLVTNNTKLFKKITGLEQTNWAVHPEEFRQ
jgi:predicted nucleic acid-binding protein